MSDVSAIEGSSDVVELFDWSEDSPLKTVDDLVCEAHQAIEKDNFERAIQIIVDLDKNQCQGQVNSTQMRELLIAIWRKDFDEGKKLLPLLSESYTLSLDGDFVEYKAVDGKSWGSFFVKRKSDKEGQALLQKALESFYNKEFEQFEKILKELMTFVSEKRVVHGDVYDLLDRISRDNIVKAIQSFPFFSSQYSIKLEEDTLFMNALDGTFIGSFVGDSSFFLIDIDRALDLLAKKETPQEKVELLLDLASLYPERASEFIQKAEEEILFIKEAPQEKVELLLDLASLYPERASEFIQKAEEEILFIKEAPQEKVELLLDLAKFYPERASEFIQKAEEELLLIDDINNKLYATGSLAWYYFVHEDFEATEMALTKIEQLTSTLEDENKKLYIGMECSLLRAETCLITKDEKGFYHQISILEPSLSKIQDEEIKEDVEDDLEDLMERAEKVFAPDPIALHACKA